MTIDFYLVWNKK